MSRKIAHSWEKPRGTCICETRHGDKGSGGKEMNRIQKSTGCSLLLLTMWLLGVVASPFAMADANSDVSITANGTCANGSTLFVITNANGSNGISAIVKQTMLVSGKTSVSTFAVSLDPNGTKQLGCSVQDPPPATNVQFSWQIQSAQYK